MMKKLRWSMIFTMLTSASLLLGACREQNTIGIIGGADGPTSIFISSSPDCGWPWRVLLLLLLLLLLALWLTRHFFGRKRR